MDAIPLPDGVPGRLMATSFSRVGDAPDAALAATGAGLLVSLVTDHEIDLRFPAFADWLTTPGPVGIVRRPIPDWGTVDDELLLQTVGVVADALRQGATVVMHCGAGMGRTGVLGARGL